MDKKSDHSKKFKTVEVNGIQFRVWYDDGCTFVRNMETRKLKTFNFVFSGKTLVKVIYNAFELCSYWKQFS